MKLPRKGCLVRADGTIVWAWEHNEAERDFESIPPAQYGLDGNLHARAHPTDVILDLEQTDLEAGDMETFYHDLLNTRARQHPDRSWRFTRVIGTAEIEHPIHAVLRTRKQLKNGGTP
jgi:hypothetical protein